MLKFYADSQKDIYVSTESGAISNSGPAEELNSSQEEADTVIILHAIHAHKRGSTIHIMSPDTDDFILSLHNVPNLGSNVAIYNRVGQKQRLIFLSDIYHAIGSEIAAALPAFHAFSVRSLQFHVSILSNIYVTLLFFLSYISFFM